MAVGVIVIGDEILSGKRQDRHFAKMLDSSENLHRLKMAQFPQGAALTPPMEAIEAQYPLVKVFSLPSVGDGVAFAPV